MITDLKKDACFEILSNNYIGHLAYVYNNTPYVIPITYFYDKTYIRVICYTGEGHKTTALRANGSAALEVAEIEFIDHYRTVLVHGTFEELEGLDAKYDLHKFTLGVKNLISERDHRKVNFIPEFSGKTHPEAQPIVYHIKIQEITGKEKLPLNEYLSSHVENETN